MWFFLFFKKPQIHKIAVASEGGHKVFCHVYLTFFLSDVKPKPLCRGLDDLQLQTLYNHTYIKPQEVLVKLY